MVKLKSLPPRSVLELETGERIEVEKIGRGKFTTAWQSVADRKVVYLQSKDEDRSKEILSFCQGPHVPELERIDGFAGDVTLYRTKFYQPLTAKSKTAWKHFRILQKHFQESWREANNLVPWGSNRPVDVNQANGMFLDKVSAETETLPEALRDAFEDLVARACDYGDYSIEIAARNLAVEGERLILLDPLFDYAYIRAENDRLRKRHEMRRYA